MKAVGWVWVVLFFWPEARAEALTPELAQAELAQALKGCLDSPDEERCRCGGNDLLAGLQPVCRMEQGPLMQVLHRRLHARKAPRRGLVTAGGVSLGSYQAGRLQGLINEARVEVLKVLGIETLARSPEVLRQVDTHLNGLLIGTSWTHLGFEQVAGASAGGINGVGFALEVCRSTLVPTFAEVFSDDPPGVIPSTSPRLTWDDSIFRRIWLDVGFEEAGAHAWTGQATVLDDHNDGNALFSGEPLENVAEQVARLFVQDAQSEERLLRAGCKVGVSFSVTSLKPVEIGKQFATVTVPVLVDLEVQPDGRMKILRPDLPPSEAPVFSVDQDVEGLMALVRATGAVPAALPAVGLLNDSQGSIYLSVGDKEYRYTAGAPEKIDLILVDGGIFNNNPLDFLLERARVPLDHIYFLDHDMPIHLRSGARVKYTGRTLWVLFQQSVASLGEIVRNQQVVAALRRQKVYRLERRSPSLSEAGFATAGFLSREFRELDYLAGHLDALEDAQRPTHWVGERPELAQLRGLYPQKGTPAEIASCETKTFLKQTWGQRCDLARAAYRQHQNFLKKCGEAADKCPVAWTKLEAGDENHTICNEARAACAETTELAELGRHLPEEVRANLAQAFEPHLVRLGDRLDDLVRGQSSGFDIPGRVLDMGMESLFIDGLTLDGVSDVRQARAMRGWVDGKLGFGLALTPILGPELSLRYPGTLIAAGNDTFLVGLARPRVIATVGSLHLFRGPQRDRSVLQLAGEVGVFTLDLGVPKIHVGGLSAFMFDSPQPGGFWWAVGGSARLEILKGLYVEHRSLFGLKGHGELDEVLGDYEPQFALGWFF